MKNYEQKIANLRMRKLAQTQEKIEKEGLSRTKMTMDG